MKQNKNDVWVAREKPIDVTEHINSILGFDPTELKDVSTTLKIDKVDFDKKIVYVSNVDEE